MRVIAGSAKRLRLKTLEGLDTRPTTDRIKETLFNMIGPSMYDCVFLDLFSGSGGIGIEALSRGAKEAVFVEMREASARSLSDVGTSLIRRRELRRFGAMTLPDRITQQGRLTIPTGFRDFTALQPGTEAFVVGVEIGAEIWNAERWKREMDIVNGHLEQKGLEEMAADLRNTGNLQ